MIKWYIIAVLFLGLFACNKSKLNTGSVTLDILHEVDGKSINWDTLIFKNSFGEDYSLQNLEYYISSISYETDEGNVISMDEIYYINARKQNAITFKLPFLNSVKVKKIHFDVGLNESLNKSYSLPSTLENINMAWPDFMGGGYHFMKLEGNFLCPDGNYGYAIHLGTPVGLVHCEIPVDITFLSEVNQYTLVMNINEIFNNPYNYSLRNNGNHTMGDSSLMSIIAKNSSDMFSFK